MEGKNWWSLIKFKWEFGRNSNENYFRDKTECCVSRKFLKRWQCEWTRGLVNERQRQTARQWQTTPRRGIHTSIPMLLISFHKNINISKFHLKIWKNGCCDIWNDNIESMKWNEEKIKVISSSPASLCHCYIA